MVGLEGETRKCLCEFLFSERCGMRFVWSAGWSFRSVFLLPGPPVGVVNAHPLTSKGLLMDTLSVVLVNVILILSLSAFKRGSLPRRAYAALLRCTPTSFGRVILGGAAPSPPPRVWATWFRPKKRGDFRRSFWRVFSEPKLPPTGSSTPPSRSVD